MLTDVFYMSLAGLFKDGSIAAGRMFMAIGSGHPLWDGELPDLRRTVTGLEQEVARKAVLPPNVQFVDSTGRPSTDPTTRVCITTEFLEDEGEGTLRELGLFGGTATPRPNSGLLLSYFVLPRIDKLPASRFRRSITVDLTPQATGPGRIATRYLGNSYSEELHDLDNLTGACQIDEIRSDRRIYFADPAQAAEFGYDYCAFCFGRERSRG